MCTHSPRVFIYAIESEQGNTVKNKADIKCNDIAECSVGTAIL